MIADSSAIPLVSNAVRKKFLAPNTLPALTGIGKIGATPIKAAGDSQAKIKILIVN
jgi:hypothetical protein